MASSSRLRKNPVTLFDVFCEVGAGLSSASDADAVGGAAGGAPIILQKYPEDFTNDPVLKSVRQFSFPCGLEDEQSEAVQLFSFVLTDSDSTYTFGFCRHTPKSNTCICILSALPWTTLFFKLLNHLAAVMNNGSQSDFDALLTRAYHTEIPNAGETFMIESSLGKNKLEVIAPDLNRLPTLRDDKYLLEFYNAVPEKQMLAVYASLLKERRVLFTGRKLSQLSSCIFAAAALIYPMHWQSIFIPVLPQNLTDMLMAPMPFLIGVPKKTLMRVRTSDLAEVVIIDLEEKSFQSPYNDLNDIPSEALQVLKSQLKSSSDMFLSDGLARSFLRTTVLLFGGYRRGFVRRNEGDKISWDKHKFVDEQKPALQPYLRSLIGTDGVQYLEQFIEERLEAMNSGRSINDEFERELRLFEHRPVKTAQMVRENASDVFGALKDRVQGIAKDASAVNLFPLLSGMNQSSSPSTSGRSISSRMDTGIREKFGRFTPKEARKTPLKRGTEIGLPVYDDSFMTNRAPITTETTDHPSMLDDPQIQSFLHTDVVRRNGTNVHTDMSNRAASMSGLELLERRQDTDLIDWGVDAQDVEFDPLAGKPAPLLQPPGAVGSPAIARPGALSPTSNVDLLASVLTPPTSSSRSTTNANVEEERQKPVSSLRQQWERFE